MNHKTISDIALIGRVMLTESSPSRLEAFSENALYCGRGMPTINKYKTVKEVCALTGLTRKHLYYFHHEKVVPAVAYANYSVEGYDGYKLYDDPAVEKLQQIALYYQLGLKRDEIKDIMLSPNYDSNLVLETLLSLEREKQVHIERHIAALEYLTLAGTKNGVNGVLRGMSLDDLGKTLLALRKEDSADHPSCKMQRDRAEALAEELAELISELSRLDDALLRTPAGSNSIRKIFELANKYLGVDSAPFILGLFMSTLGEGTIAQGITDNLSPAHGRAVIQYLIDHPETYIHSSHISDDEHTNNTGRNIK